MIAGAMTEPPTPDELRAAAARRIPVSRYAAARGHTNSVLGDSYSTLSVKVPADTAAAVASTAADLGITISAFVRTCIDQGLTAHQEGNQP